MLAVTSSWIAQERYQRAVIWLINSLAAVGAGKRVARRG
jgi:hypothetical protein